MKPLKFLVVLCFVFGFAMNNTQAQAFVIHDQTRVLWTDYGPYLPMDSYAVLTPSGNLLISVTYQLDLEDPLVPDKGVNKVPVWGGTGGNDWIWSWNGMRYAFTDAEMIVNSNGKAKIVYLLKHTDYYEDLP
jgi:hypothetical protein